MPKDDKSEMQIKSVFHSVNSILRVLRNEQIINLAGVDQLLSTFDTTFPEGVDFHDSKRRELFVVFEGLDGSGKSTISRNVAKALNGVLMATPPKIVSHLRKDFDGQPVDIRRAYYSLGNYIAAKEIQMICQEKPVFLDRFWHSTAAYGLAQEFDGQPTAALPSAGDPVYQWPQDLMKPDLVLFLDVDEETRHIRHSRRKKTTVEEDQLAKDEAFRNLVLSAYNHMGDVPIVHIDSSKSIKQTTELCLKEINHLSSANQDS